MDLFSKQYDRPILLTDWLTFLPSTCRNVSAMYQRPSSDEVVLFIDTNVYVINEHTLQLVQGFPQSITALGVHIPRKVNAVIHTYTRLTFLFYNDEYFGEIDEWSFKIKKYGYTKDYFAGLPFGIDSAFRYTDDKIYFFKDDGVYVYTNFLTLLKKVAINPVFRLLV